MGNRLVAFLAATFALAMAAFAVLAFLLVAFAAFLLAAALFAGQVFAVEPFGELFLGGFTNGDNLAAEVERLAGHGMVEVH